MAHASLHDPGSGTLVVVPLTIDDFASLRYLHATTLRAHTAEVLSDAEVSSFTKLVNSPEYTDLLMKEEVYGGWLHGELVGTASWYAGPDNASTARIGSVFVRHPRLGIGRQLLTYVEARAHQSGFVQFAACATANAVPFFERQGYRAVSRGVRVLTPDCALPVTFFKKASARHRHAPPSTLM